MILSVSISIYQITSCKGLLFLSCVNITDYTKSRSALSVFISISKTTDLYAD